MKNKKQSSIVLMVVVLTVLLSILGMDASVSYALNDGELTDAWDLSELYGTEEAFYEALNVFSNYIKAIDDNTKNLYTSEQAFVDSVIMIEQGEKMSDQLRLYASLRYMKDTTDAVAIDMIKGAERYYNEYVIAQSNFFTVFSEMSSRTQERYLNNDQISTIAGELFLETVDDGSYSDEATMIYLYSSNLFDTPVNVYNSFVYNTELDSLLPQVQYEDLSSRNWELVYPQLENMNMKHLIGIHVLAAALEGQIKVSQYNATSYGADNYRSLDLAQNGLSEDEFYRMFDMGRENASAFHKWVEFVGDIHGIDKVHAAEIYYDVLEKNSNSYTYQEAATIVKEALKPLGPEYQQVFQEAITSNWVDVYPSDGKYNGAQELGIYGFHPYVMLNYEGTLTDVSTLAHEMGHAINDYYTFKVQGGLESVVPVFNAEIASTTNEILLYEYMLEQAKTDEEKLDILYNYINLIHETVFEQLILAEFEDAIYNAYDEGITLNAMFLNETYQNLCKVYYGERFESDPVNDIGWSYISHFYNAYYVYKYVTGISCGMQFADSLLSGDEEAVEDYLLFLSSGSTDVPAALLKRSGVDINGMEPLQLVFDRYEDLVGQFVELYSGI